MIFKNTHIRNIAIIAHVDHGKTTLVDQMLKQGGAFRSNQTVADRVMDSNDLEKERGITILAKNTSIKYGNYKINVIDTPGHADFGGEVERVLKMVDGVLLVVDSYEGAMPQTRFVLQHALALKLKVIICINKIDKADARPDAVLDEVLELFLDLNATSEQLDSPVIYCSGRAGTSSETAEEQGADLMPLFEKIVRYIPAPEGDLEAPLQMLISSLDYSDYVGSIGIGRIDRGRLLVNQQVVITDFHHIRPTRRVKISNIYQFEGLARVAVDDAGVGDIVCVAGVEDVTIGDTLCDPAQVEPLEFVKISEPSVEMTFAVNDSPFAGREGKFITSRHLRERLYKERLKDVSIRISDTETADKFKVCGRGEMHLAILIETMRREGFEFQVSQPHVLFQEIDGVKCEPMDMLLVDVPEEAVGNVMSKMGLRKGELVQMTPIGNRMRMEFKIPTRGLFGYKSEFLTDTKGEGIMSSISGEFEPYHGEINRRQVGSLIAWETGESNAYGLFNAQERGVLFIGAGIPVYEGMVVGENPKNEDLIINVCKKKALSNMRTSSSDEALHLSPPHIMSLEEALEFLADDEFLEVTPKSIRIRKRVLDKGMRSKSNIKK